MPPDLPAGRPGAQRGWFAVALTVLLLIGALILARELDPRPGHEALRDRLRLSLAELDALSLDGLAEDRAAAALISASLATSGRLSAAALDDLRDPNLRDFAERNRDGAAGRVAAMQALTPQACCDAAGTARMGAMRLRILGETRAAIATKTVPDRIFVLAILALYEGMVEAAGDLRDRSKDPRMQALADEVLLLEQSAIGAMLKWLNFDGH